MPQTLRDTIIQGLKKLFNKAPNPPKLMPRHLPYHHRTSPATRKQQQLEPLRVRPDLIGTPKPKPPSTTATPAKQPFIRRNHGFKHLPKPPGAGAVPLASSADIISFLKPAMDMPSWNLEPPTNACYMKIYVGLHLWLRNSAATPHPRNH